MNDIVIARYKEDLEWINQIPEDFNVYIYNKGDVITSASVRQRATIVDRPNTGRETETYLHHLINYVEKGSSAGEFTVFSQGDPREHSPDFLELLKAWQQWKDVQPLSWRWRGDLNIPPKNVIEANQRAYINGLRVRRQLLSLITWSPVDFIDLKTYDKSYYYRAIHGLPEGANVASHYFAACGFEEQAQRASEHLLGQFAYGAIFAARTKIAQRFPVEAMRAMQGAACTHWVYGYLCEGLWLHLFGEKFLLPISKEHPKHAVADLSFAKEEMPAILPSQLQNVSNANTAVASY